MDVDDMVKVANATQAGNYGLAIALMLGELDRVGQRVAALDRECLPPTPSPPENAVVRSDKSRCSYCGRMGSSTEAGSPCLALLAGRRLCGGIMQAVEVESLGSRGGVARPDAVGTPFEQPRDKSVPLPVVGRCKDCKHWREHLNRKSGECDEIALEKQQVAPQEYPFGERLLVTRPDFGCVHFESNGVA